MLLNEFLKEHHKVEEQAVAMAQQRKDFETISKLKAIAAQQGKQIQVLTAGIQKVSEELQLSKPAPTTVVESP